MGGRPPYGGRLLEELPLFHHVFGMNKQEFFSLTMREYRAYRDYLQRLKEQDGR